MLSLCCFSSQVVFATTFTWSGGGGVGNKNWTNAANWSGTAPVSGGEGDLVFPPVTQFDANDDFASFTADSITISSDGYSITGNAFTLGSPTGANTLNQTAGAFGLSQISNNLTLGANDLITINVTQNDTLILSGNISGTNSITNNGLGTLILSGNNTGWSGTFFLENGFIQISNPNNLNTGQIQFDGASGLFLSSGFNGTIANPITTVDNADAILALADGVSVNLAGSITDIFALDFSGNATATLSGSNAFQELMGDAGMTVNIANVNALNGTSLIFFRDLLNFNFPSGTMTITGQLTGTGELTMNSPGTLIITATTNNYEGGTVINSGKVFVDGVITGASPVVSVNAGGFLGGAGSVGFIVNGGTVGPGDLSTIGTLSVTNTYTQEPHGTLNIRIDEMGDNDKLAITGGATLAGTLNVTAQPGSYMAGTTYTILNSLGGFTTKFSTVNLPTVPSLMLTYDPFHSVLLTVVETAVLFGKHVHHHNPQQVLKYLQKIDYPMGSDIATVAHSFTPLSENALTKALDQLHPAIFGAFDLLNINTSSMVSGFLNRHMADICCQHLKTCSTDTDNSFWVEPFGYYYNQNRIGEQVGFRAYTEGVATGINSWVLDGLTVGVGGAYSYGHIDWKEHRGNGRVNSGYLGVNADYVWEPFFFEAAAIAGANAYHAQRNIEFSTIDRHARHHHRGFDFTAHLGGGGDIRLGAFYLKPYTNIDYLYLYQKQFKERGAGDLNLKVHGRHANTLRSEIGLSFSRSFKFGEDGCWMPTIFISGINECYLRKRHYRSRFQNQTLEFLVRTFNKPIYLVSPGIDFTFTSGTGSSVALRYSAELNGQIATQKGDLRFEWFY